MTTNHDDKHNFKDGIRLQQVTDNVTTPTEAELITAFGAAADKGRGWMGTIDDNDGDTSVILVIASDASYYFTALTKAS